jgi:hypothetical protein
MTNVLIESILNRPVSLTKTGDLVTLKQYVKKELNDIILLDDLLLEQWAKVTIAQANIEFDNLTSISRTIYKEQAIDGLEKLNDTGKLVIELNSYTTKMLVKEFEDGRLNKFLG